MSFKKNEFSNENIPHWPDSYDVIIPGEKPQNTPAIYLLGHWSPRSDLFVLKVSAGKVTRVIKAIVASKCWKIEIPGSYDVIISGKCPQNAPKTFIIGYWSPIIDSLTWKLVWVRFFVAERQWKRQIWKFRHFGGHFEVTYPIWGQNRGYKHKFNDFSGEKAADKFWIVKILV